MDTSSVMWTSVIKIAVSLVGLLTAISRSAVVPPVSNYVSYPNQNCPGNDFKSPLSDTPDVCSSSCDQEGDCVAFVFVSFPLPFEESCNLKRVCDVLALTEDPSTHVYIKAALETGDALGSIISTAVVPDNTAKEVTEMTFLWFTYSQEKELSEAPMAVPIGNVMIVLLIGFILFFILLDLENYRNGLKRGFNNCLPGTRGRRKRKKNKTQWMKVDGIPVKRETYDGIGRSSSPSGLNHVTVHIECVDETRDCSSS